MHIEGKTSEDTGKWGSSTSQAEASEETTLPIPRFQTSSLRN